MPALATRAVDIPELVEAITKKIKKENKSADLPIIKESALSELMRYPWPGNVRELRNVIERASLLFPGRSVENNDVRNNLLRIKAPDPLEEQEALWLASADFTHVDQEKETTSPPLPHPSHYQDWFSYFNNIDLRRHLQDVEIVLIEAALKRSEGMISSAAEALKLNRTTLIEKMKKYLIEKPEKSD
jgi:sigma-54 specific flagellar transcriptional regulator A